jgi:hypothetical protein
MLVLKVLSKMFSVELFRENLNYFEDLTFDLFISLTTV